MKNPIKKYVKRISLVGLPVLVSFVLLFSNVALAATDGNTIPFTFASKSLTISDNYYGSGVFSMRYPDTGDMTVNISSFDVSYVSAQTPYYESVFSGSCEYVVPITLSFPAGWRNKVVSGTFNHFFPLSHSEQFWASEANQISIGQLYDLSHRINISLGDLPEGVTGSLIFDQFGYYYLDLSFNDFFISQNNLSVDIPLIYSFYVSGAVQNVDQDRVLLSSITHRMQFNNVLDLNTNINVVNFYAPTFRESNLYYTIMQAMEDALSGVGGSGSGSVSGIATEQTLSDISTLLSSWSSNVSDLSSISSSIGGFPSFANSVLTYLGAVSASQSQIQTYLNQLLVLIDQTDDLETYLYNIYYTINTLETSGAALSAFAPYRTIRSMLTAFVIGFTGLNPYSTYSFSTIRDNVFDRWVQLIGDAIESKLDLANKVSTEVLESYADTNEAIESGASVAHDYEVSVWEDVFDQLDDMGVNVTPPSSTLPAAVWFTSAIEYILGDLGPFGFVVSVCLVGGLIVVIIGRVNQFPSPDFGETDKRTWYTGHFREFDE